MAVIVPLPTRARTGSALQKSKSNIVIAHRKKRVLSLRLNELTVSASRTAAGILFHTTGPATEKALSPNFVLVSVHKCRNFFFLTLNWPFTLSHIDAENVQLVWTRTQAVCVMVPVGLIVWFVNFRKFPILFSLNDWQCILILYFPVQQNDL